MPAYTVLLLCEKVSDRVVLLSKMYSRIGLNTLILYKTDHKSWLKHCEESFLFRFEDELNLDKILDQLKFSLIHYFNFGPDLTGLTLLRKNVPYLYDYKDLFTSLRNHPLSDAARAVELHLVTRALAITNRDQQITLYVERNCRGLNTPRLVPVPDFQFFQSPKDLDCRFNLTNDILSRQGNEFLNIVCTGGVTPESRIGQDATGISTLITLLSKYPNIKLDIIGGYSNVVTEYQVSEHIPIPPNVRILPGLSPQEFHNALTEYDFAVHIANADLATYDEDAEGCYQQNSVSSFVSARLFSYAYAGLPLIIGSSFRWNVEYFESRFPVLEVNRNNAEYLFRSLVRSPSLRLLAKLKSPKFYYLEHVQSFKSNMLQFIS